jgi:hypothetical protein
MINFDFIDRTEGIGTGCTFAHGNRPIGVCSRTSISANFS